MKKLYSIQFQLYDIIDKAELCRGHHPCGRKRTGTKEPLDENEGGE